MAAFATLAAVTSAVTFSAPGQYNVTLTVTDSNGHTATDPQTIHVARVLEVAGADGAINDQLADEMVIFPTWAGRRKTGISPTYACVNGVNGMFVWPLNQLTTEIGAITMVQPGTGLR